MAGMRSIPSSALRAPSSRTKLRASAESLLGSRAASSSTSWRTSSESGSASACENTTSRTGFDEAGEGVAELRRRRFVDQPHPAPSFAV